jgi:hypothetical protein
MHGLFSENPNGLQEEMFSQYKNPFKESEYERYPILPKLPPPRIEEPIDI